MTQLPKYDELPVVDGAPPGSSWGLWGADDVLGCLNLLTPETAKRAATLIRKGAVFPLDWELQLPDPPLFNRDALVHRVLEKAGEYTDDVIDGYNTQSSSQWDGFRHVTLDGQLYNGRSPEEHGVDHWARKGIVGRAVLADVAAHRAAQGRPLRLTESEDIGADELQQVFASQGTTVEPGDILLVHIGWHDWYRGLEPRIRAKLATLRAPRCPGLRAGREMVAYLWDQHFAAVASDTPTFEVSPYSAGLSEDEAQSSYATLHHNLIPKLGIPIGEIWDLSALARDCAADGVYDCFLSSAPVHVRSGVGSPPNATAVK